MTTTVQTAFRLPAELVERIDAYAAELGARIHVTITRTDAVQMLVQSALNAAGASAAPKQMTLPGVKPRAKKRRKKLP